VVLSGAVGGGFSLAKEGVSSLTLGGANTFTGGVTVSTGSVCGVGDGGVDDEWRGGFE
jgi:autotransporter-associated beta strand protein